MRKKNQLHIREAIESYFIQNGMEDKLMELKIAEIWKTEFGKAIKNRTQNIRFENGKLTIYLTSSVLKEELLYGKTAIQEKLNSKLPKRVIRELRLA